ncbi:MAG: PdxA family dehydrogenase, partial [Limisphaerales bacterium]
MIGITLGDVTGIGPEVVVKALVSELSQDATQYLVIGDRGVFDETCRKLNLNLSFDTGFNPNSRVAVFNPTAIQFSEISNLKKGDPKAAIAAVEWLKYGATLCLNKRLEALVTAPVNKEAIISAGLTGFVGQTELLSQISETRNTAMMLLGCDEQNRWVRVVLATTHVPIRRLADVLSIDKVALAIQMAHLACKALGLERGKIGVCGLNPHAGEGGKIGNEEQTVIEPAIQMAKQHGVNVEGPFA